MDSNLFKNHVVVTTTVQYSSFVTLGTAVMRHSALAEELILDCSALAEFEIPYYQSVIPLGKKS